MSIIPFILKIDSLTGISIDESKIAILIASIRMKFLSQIKLVILFFTLYKTLLTEASIPDL